MSMRIRTWLGFWWIDVTHAWRNYKLARNSTKRLYSYLWKD